MPKNFEKKIVCKNCNEQEIGLFEGKWFNTDNENQLHFTICANAPHKQNSGYKSQYRSKTKNIEFEAVVMQLNELKDRLTNIEEAVKGLVLEVSYKKGNGEPVATSD